ncbi:transcription repressor OFP14 [Impatiens glandulifera]|uniref:transcription repressor OFP14 n=1 Tax=Impatiens glandulifera TaxID=253017 RepID=UPI001FB0C69B|nr:transcription repressor OFP14 [Impatiens glandulifera]
MTKKSSDVPGNWILGGCKYPKTLFDDNCEDDHNVRTKNRNRRKKAATLSDIDQFLIENFKSLYLGDGELQGDDEESVDLSKKKKNLDHKRSSKRVFVDGGSSSSRVEESRTSETISWDEFGSFSSVTSEASNEVKEEIKEISPDEFIAVFTYSTCPHDEFRVSMKAMVDARLRQDGKVVDWKFMEELLFCYLNLNDKKSYKYILNAFVDLIAVLREDPGKTALG